MRASFDVKGLQAAISVINMLGKEGTSVAKKMLNAGAKECEKAQKAAIEAHGHVDTGSMRDNVKPTKIIESGDSLSTNIYPQGTDAKGTSNAMKAFILHYGTSESRIKGDRWFDDATAASERDAVPAMEKVFDDFIAGGK